MATPHSLTISRVQRFCLKDGPGIRTTVFLQGCPLRCWWCHNADLQPASSERARYVSVDALATELLRDGRYWTRSGGGVTLSGGEPLQQAEVCTALLTNLGECGIHRCVDTSGAAAPEAVAAMMPYVDLWLFDIKTADAEAYGEATDGELGVAMDNLRTLVTHGRNVRVRVPLIQGFNIMPATLEDIGCLVAGLDTSIAVDLLPGHDVGRVKGPAAAVSREQCAEAKRIMENHVRHVEVRW